MPRVTIAIPTYKRGALLRRAVRSALEQTFHRDMEILVVENPSEPLAPGMLTFAETLCLELADPRIRYVRNSANVGMAGNWNRCLELAQSAWVVILHDDDWLAPRYVEISLALVDSNPALRLVCCYGFIEREGLPEQPDEEIGSLIRSIRLAPIHFLLGNPVPGPGIMMHRETALKLGGFDPGWFPTMDHVLWLRFCETAPCARIQHRLTHYSIGDNVSLKPAMLISFIVNDWKQRQELLDRAFFRNPILQAYSRIKVHRERAFLQNRFRIKIPSQDLEDSLTEVGWRPFSRAFRWVYFPLRVVIEVVSWYQTVRLKAVHVVQVRGQVDPQSSVRKP